MIWVVTALAVVVALLAVLVAGLLRSHADILRALHDLGVNLDPGAEEGSGRARTFSAGARPSGAGPSGEPTPTGTGPLDAAVPSGGPGRVFDLRGTTPEGEAVAVAVLDAEAPTLLAFLSSGCGTCQEFWAALSDPHREPIPGFESARLIAVTRGPDEESPATVAGLAPPEELTLMSSEAFEDYGVAVAPYFVLVAGRGGPVLGEGAASSWVQLGSLIGKAVADGVRGGAGAAAVSRRDVLGGRGADRRRRADRELEAAGILPGDPSLYPPSSDAIQGSPEP